jgi:sugar/nucleoside kinase (ribokinase family)
MGSSSAIFASNSSSLGADVAFCGKIGADAFGNLVLDSLQEKRVNTDFIIADKQQKTGATSIYRFHNDRMMVTYPGAMESLTLKEIPEKLFELSRHLHTSSVFFQPGIKKDLVSLFKKAKDHGLSTSLDTQWDPNEKWDIDFELLQPYLDFFLPNDDEVLRITGTSNINEALDYFTLFPSTCVVIKRGKKGAVMQYEGNRRYIAAYKVPDFEDAGGAGDSCNAGFITEYLKGKDLNRCLETGNIVAAVSTTGSGGTAAIHDYDQVLSKGKSFQMYSV